jgi:damage-control phosphatase, subfamily I
MKPHPECGACLVHWVYERAAAHTAPEDTSALTRRIVGILLKETTPTANVGALCNSTVWAALETTPALAKHYEQLKAESNKHARSLLPEAAAHIMNGDTARAAFERACFLAAAANVSPLSAPSGAYTFSEMRPFMSEEGPAPAVVGNAYGAVKAASRVLYVTDNAGEIGFDSLVLTQLKAMGKHVTLVVKTKTFFEDATMSDALFFGLNGLVDEIVATSGFLAPGNLEPPVERALAQSDLVLAKGTGSYEALKDELGRKHAIFMLKVKCPAIARETGLDTGATVVKLEGR